MMLTHHVLAARMSAAPVKMGKRQFVKPTIKKVSPSHPLSKPRCHRRGSDTDAIQPPVGTAYRGLALFIQRKPARREVSGGRG